jgi:hypothetical protein
VPIALQTSFLQSQLRWSSGFTPGLRTTALHSRPPLPPFTPALHSRPSLLPFTAALHSRPSLPPFTPARYSRPPLPPSTTALHSRPSLPPFTPALDFRHSLCRSPRFIPALCTPDCPLFTPTLRCAARHPSFRRSSPFTLALHCTAHHPSFLLSSPFTPPPFTPALHSRPPLPPSTPALHSGPSLPPFTPALHSRPSLPPFTPALYPAALHSRPSPCRSSRLIPPLFTPHPPCTATLHCAAHHYLFRLSTPLHFTPALHSSTLHSCPSLRRPPSSPRRPSLPPFD